MPFQRAGVAALRDRLTAGAGGVLLADEMGLGKTIQAIGIVNLALAGPGCDRLRVLVIAPKIALLNWRNEMSKWLVRPLSVAVWTTKAQPEADVVIVNYDIVSKLSDKIRETMWDYLIADEAHALKEGKSQRTKAVLGGKGTDPIPARHRIFVTGTPILNRPIELFPILHACGVDYARDFFGYAKRYCGGRQERFGFKADGASNLAELQERLRATVMVRRMKSDVLTELPDKRHQVVTVGADSSDAVRAALRDEARATQAHGKALAKAEAARAKAEKAKDQAALDRAVSALTALRASHLGEVAVLRQRTALAKAPEVVEHVTDILDSVEGAVLVFAYHREVIDGLAEGFRAAGHDPAIIVGDTSPADRQQAQDDVQEGRKRVFLGSMHACGVAITLTAASHVVFAEQDWSPGIMAQAEDRAHRIGQKGSVLVQYLVVDGSIDATLMQSSHGKAGVAAAALDLAPEEATEVEAVSVSATKTESASVIPSPSAEIDFVPPDETEIIPIVEAPVLESVSAVETKSPAVVEQPAPVIEPEEEVAPEPEAEPIFVAPDRNEEIAYVGAASEPQVGDENETSSVTRDEIPAAVESVSAEPVDPPAEAPPAAESASTAEPARRKRGRPPLGDQAMSAAERSRRYRQSHGDGTRLVRLPSSVATRLEEAAERRGISVDVALTFALDELDRGYLDRRRRRAA
ncbi:DEAD/DEAH box helicase [Aureimonas ureilytica]|nr:SNF2-related protein [Aureimonas ureilytica]